MILASSPISWDLRNANSNLVYLGLVMAGYGLAGRRPALAGVLVGLSVSLKLYSGLLMAWLMVNGPRRMFYAGAAAMAVLWIVLPVAFFGIEGTVRLYAGWRDQVAHIADLSYHASLMAEQGNHQPDDQCLHRPLRRNATYDVSGAGRSAAICRDDDPADTFRTATLPAVVARALRLRGSASAAARLPAAPCRARPARACRWRPC